MSDEGGPKDQPDIRPQHIPQEVWDGLKRIRSYIAEHKRRKTIEEIEIADKQQILRDWQAQAERFIDTWSGIPEGKETFRKESNETLDEMRKKIEELEKSVVDRGQIIEDAERELKDVEEQIEKEKPKPN